MKIGKDWEIKSDSLNVILSKRGWVKKTDDKPGHYTWKNVGYFSSVKYALGFLVDVEISSTELTDLKTIVKKQDELYKLIGGLK